MDGRPLRRQRLGSASMMNPLKGCFLFVDKFVDRDFSGYILKLKGKIIDAKGCNARALFLNYCEKP
jgi:hypothetical protein